MCASTVNASMPARRWWKDEQIAEARRVFCKNAAVTRTQQRQSEFHFLIFHLRQPSTGQCLCEGGGKIYNGTDRRGKSVLPELLVANSLQNRINCLVGQNAQTVGDGRGEVSCVLRASVLRHHHPHLLAYGQQQQRMIRNKHKSAESNNRRGDRRPCFERRASDAFN